MRPRWWPGVVAAGGPPGDEPMTRRIANALRKGGRRSMSAIVKRGRTDRSDGSFLGGRGGRRGPAGRARHPHLLRRRVHDLVDTGRSARPDAVTGGDPRLAVVVDPRAAGRIAAGAAAERDGLDRPGRRLELV